jgi:hypothetical protein
VTSDKAIRLVTALAVLAVAVIAATVSYSHIEYLALVNGQTLTAARLLPASVDGVVLVSSMVMLDAARRDVDAPVLARVMLVAGVLATLAANSAVGASHGVVGILVSGWPAVAFIGCAETFLAMIRRRSGALSGTAETADETTIMGVPEVALAGGYSAAHGVPEADEARTRPDKALSPSASHRRTPNQTPEQIFAEELSAGTVPGIRSIKTRCKVGQPRAEAIQARLAALIEAHVSEPAATIS